MRTSMAGLLLLWPLAAHALSWSAYDLGLYGISPTQHYVSTAFTSPQMNILQWDARCERDGAYVLISPRGYQVENPGPIMLDNRGNLVWTETRFGQVTNLQVQQYRGESYLTFWAGASYGPHSNGSYYMLDSAYEIAKKVDAVGPDVAGDLHEFKITDNNTALMTIYQDHEVACSRLGIDSSSSCWINDGLFQEVDIETGDLIFQWRASDHVKISDSYKGRGSEGTSKENSYDYFHINSVHKDPLGNYYISSRYMFTVYCISPAGDILWYLGGKNNNFTDLSGGYATNFAYQHHANWHENNTFTIFDNNGNNVFHNPSEFSRGMTISLDLTAMTATLLRTYVHPDRILAISQGSTQQLPDSGNVFVGWGNSPAYTEFTGEGEVLCNVHYGAGLFFELIDLGWVKSYRSFKGQWIGKPKTRPDIKVVGGQVYVSWNGATELAGWRLQSAASADATDEDFEDVDELPRETFETAFVLGDVEGAFFRAAALDKSGAVLGYTNVTQSTPEPTVTPFLSIIFLALFLLGFFLVVRRYRSTISRQLWKISSSRKISPQQYELLNSDEEPNIRG
ncbi:hypothetical protein BP5796_06421 [Coleophoma crateriformis]|uniref:ASST-domain-containing protein n=1 Tax=Coleophoma crateriformis TaxID=565419 RepID=A0A3D8RNR6_9HELO|nr:hypothetical protein BP5796_06421 [Coleophoma crateriformis]